LKLNALRYVSLRYLLFFVTWCLGVETTFFFADKESRRAESEPCATSLRPYSARSIRAGSMRTARITGGNAATSAATRMVNAGSASILGSPGFTW